MYAFFFRLPFRVRFDYQGSIAFVAAGVIVPGSKPLVKPRLGWCHVRRLPAAQATLRGANATVVGRLLTALYQPVFTSAVHAPADLIMVLAAFGLLVLWRCPPWTVVDLAVAAGKMLLR